MLPGACVCAQLHQSCPTLCNPLDCSPPASSVHGILQARIVEWVAMPFSRGPSGPGIELGSPALQVDSSPLSHQEACAPWYSGTKSGDRTF